ncbi:MAG: 2TM domain-containing protein [Bacteroidota bacterium]
METTNEKRYEKAQKRVEALKGFYAHLMVYTAVIILLIVLNIYTTAFPWVLFPALGWGFGLLAHGLDAHQYNPFLGKDWEARKIEELMKKDSF